MLTCHIQHYNTSAIGKLVHFKYYGNRTVLVRMHKMKCQLPWDTPWMLLWTYVSLTSIACELNEKFAKEHTNRAGIHELDI